MENLFQFPPEKRRIIFEKGDFSKASKKKKGKIPLLERTISSHPFNIKVETFIPSNDGIENGEVDLGEISLDHLTHQKISAPLARFLDPTFLQKYLWDVDGSLSVLCLDRKIDRESSFCISPPGCLILYADKDMYEKLGLTGMKSKFDGQNCHYISIDLIDKTFRPKKNNFKKVIKYVSEMFPEPSDFLVSYKRNGDICEIELDSQSSVDDIEMNETKTNSNNASPSESLKTLKVEGKYDVLENIYVPEFKNILTQIYGDVNNSETISKEDVETTINEIVEWFGILALRIFEGLKTDPENIPEENLSSLSPFSFDFLSLKKCSKNYCREWSGFFTPESIIQLVYKCKKLLSNSLSIPYIAIMVWGAHDTPESWKGNQHGYFDGGENDYIILLLPEDKYIILKLLSKWETLQ